jgi:putative membrane protein
MMEKQNRQRNDYILSIVKGALAGGVATIPMTAAMLALHRFLPRWQRHSLPPTKIAMSMASRLGLKQHLEEPQQHTAAWLSHFACGIAMGAAYGPLTRRVSVPSLVKGPTFGLLVWAGSYLGWLPAMELPEAAADQPMERNALMIGAHLIWGAVLGPLVNRLER